MELVRASIDFVKMAVAVGHTVPPVAPHEAAAAVEWDPGPIEDAQTGGIMETPEMRAMGECANADARPGAAQSLQLVGTRLLRQRMDGEPRALTG